MAKEINGTKNVEANKDEVELVNLQNIGKGVGQVVKGIGKGLIGVEELEAFTQSVETKQDGIGFGIIGGAVNVIKGVGNIVKGATGKELATFVQTEPDFLA